MHTQIDRPRDRAACMKGGDGCIHKPLRVHQAYRHVDELSGDKDLYLGNPKSCFTEKALPLADSIDPVAQQHRGAAVHCARKGCS
jgi:hypothetical protein